MGRPLRRLGAGVVITVTTLASCAGPAPERRLSAPTSSTTTRPPTSASTPSRASTAPRPATTQIGKLTIAFVDHSRPAISHGRTVAPYRSLTTTVWYPFGPPAPRPLVLFAHGYRIGVSAYSRVLEVWARHGYVVAAPSFPLTDQTVAGASLDENDLVNQPGDVTFVLTQLLGLDATPDSVLSGRIDPAHVAVAGHSDGADTALAIGYLPAQRDPRVGVVISDAPDPLPLRPDAPRIVSTVPLLLVHGDRDSISPFSGSQRVMAQLSTPGWFLVLRGADHLPPIQGPSSWTATFDRVTVDFLAGASAGQLAADVQGAPAGLLPLRR